MDRCGPHGDLLLHWPVARELAREHVKLEGAAILEQREPDFENKPGTIVHRKICGEPEEAFSVAAFFHERHHRAIAVKRDVLDQLAPAIHDTGMMRPLIAVTTGSDHVGDAAKAVVP